MEEEQKLEQAKMEMLEGAAEATLLVRKPRSGNDQNTTEIASADENGHSESVENGAEIEEETPAEERKLNVLLQEDSEAITGDQTPKHIVLYDNVEGVKSESVHFGVNQTPGHIKPQISSRVFVDQNNSTSSSNDKEEVYNSNSYQPFKKIKNEEVDSINKDDLEVKDLDVERVLQKQTTHDLFCPNCNSCITKRVIIRKRKRSDHEGKRRPVSTPRRLVPKNENHGNSLNLFRIVDVKTRKENIWDKRATSVEKDRFTSMYGPDNEKEDNLGKLMAGKYSGVDECTISVATEMSQTQGVIGEVEIEVVKSIIYGGLAESVISLSVVASAAGVGATTLNVLALGAANLIGGLFIICHNLWDFKNHHSSEQMSNQIVEQSDRNEELLGRRHNFIFHFIVAIISYLVFGLVPPIVYGFSFRESDDQQLKLMVVGAASLLCVLMLAIGKAYTQRPPKRYMKTVATYVILGFMASGVSYVAGELVERLLNKLGLFQTGSTPEMRPTVSGWASY